MQRLGLGIHEFAASDECCPEKLVDAKAKPCHDEYGVTCVASPQCLCVSANAFFCSPLASFWCLAFHSSYGMP